MSYFEFIKRAAASIVILFFLVSFELLLPFLILYWANYFMPAICVFLFILVYLINLVFILYNVFNRGVTRING